MESYVVFKDLAIIIVAAKFCGILARKCKAPQVVGEIIAGLIIGPSILGWVNHCCFDCLCGCVCPAFFGGSALYGILRCVSVGVGRIL